MLVLQIFFASHRLEPMKISGKCCQKKNLDYEIMNNEFLLIKRKEFKKIRYKQGNQDSLDSHTHT
jgi:hypothetical protein